MNYETAKQAIDSGKTVTRETWNGLRKVSLYALPEAMAKQLGKSTAPSPHVLDCWGIRQPWTPSDADRNATDWRVDE